ncbi:hypothetical protein V2J09_014962 [Rumex salicifolius]
MDWYCKVSAISDADYLFDEITNPDVFSDSPDDDNVRDDSLSALLYFREMKRSGGEANAYTLTSIVTACAKLSEPEVATQIHSFIVKAGFLNVPGVRASLISMYSKLGEICHSEKLFLEVENVEDPCLWASMMTAYSQNQGSEKAKDLFRRMLKEGYAQMGYKREALLLFLEMMSANIQFDPYTISSVLGVAALQEETDIGTQLHALTMKFGFFSKASVGSSLVMMYSRSGNVESCRKAFDQITNPDLVVWTTMIISYAQNGKGKEALNLYELMKMEGIRPDSVTFVGVLLACSHAGLVEEGYVYLNSMSKDYGLEPGLRHYACMVDVLGRFGRLEEAERFINNMPIEPDALIWGTLVAACQVHGNIEVAKRAASKVMDLKPSETGPYIAFSNIHAEVGKWDEVVLIRSLMKGAGLNKDPGWSYAMAMAALSNGRSHLRDASFSSYLDTTDTDFVRSLAASMHNGSSPVFTPSRQSSSSYPSTSPSMSKQRIRSPVGELGVFGAENFSEKLDHLHQHHQLHHHERTPSFKSVEDPVSKTTTHKSKSRTPSMRSESSWTSKSSRYTDQTKPKKSLGGPWFLSGLQCKGSCYDVKPPVYTNHLMIKQPSSSSSTATTTNQRKGFWEDQVVQINLKKQPCHPKFAVLPNTQEEEDHPRKSIEVFGLHNKPDDDMSLVMEKKLSMLSWDAIPIQNSRRSSASCRYDDMDSDASSDLFDIPVFPAEMSSPVTAAYEPSEASIEWSVVTASATGFYTVSDLEEKTQIGTNTKTTKPKEHQRSVVNGGILGCRSNKAVKVVTPNARMASFPPKKTQLAGPIMSDCQV